jgi:hypothetical protein
MSITALREILGCREGNFLRVPAGGGIGANAFASDWPSIVKIVSRPDAAPDSPATIKLPAARLWTGRDLLIVDAAGAGFVLVPAGSDEIFGDRGERRTVAHGDQFSYRRPVLRLVPMLSDLHGEQDAWVTI